MTHVRVQMFGGSSRKTVDMHDRNVQVLQVAAAPAARRRTDLQARDLSMLEPCDRSTKARRTEDA